MKIQTIIHASDSQKTVVERIIKENLEKKLSTYLKKFDGENVEGIITFDVEENKKGLYNGTLNITIDGNKFYYSREDYKNLDDLVNNLFTHFKEELSSK